MESETFKALDKALASQVSQLNDNFLKYLLISFILLGLLYLVAQIYRIIFPSKYEKLIREYKKTNEQLSADSEHKSFIFTLLDQINREIPTLIKLKENNSAELDERARHIIHNMIVDQIPLALKSMKNIRHRCAVFIVDNSDYSKLMIFEGCGYSLDGKEKLRLEINNSMAGEVFRTGKIKYSGDVSKEKSFKPHPKATKKYRSLLCVPVIVRDQVIGVLSLDGSEKDCFTQDDIDYVRIFSNLLAIIMDLMTYNFVKEEIIDVTSEGENTG
jgi:putative methionine-R-sulfoxide reductase with GAF domain